MNRYPVVLLLICAGFFTFFSIADAQTQRPAQRRSASPAVTVSVGKVDVAPVRACAEVGYDDADGELFWVFKGVEFRWGSSRNQYGQSIKTSRSECLAMLAALLACDRFQFEHIESDDPRIRLASKLRLIYVPRQVGEVAQSASSESE